MSLPDHGLPMEIQKDSAPVNSMNEGNWVGVVVHHLQFPKQEAHSIVWYEGRLNGRIIPIPCELNMMALRTNPRTYIRRHEMPRATSEPSLHINSPDTYHGERTQFQ
jgi:hypothetical protein